MIEKNEDILTAINELKQLVIKQYPVLATITEASSLLRIGQSKLRELTFRRDFPVIKIGSKRLINMKKIDAWLEKHQGEVL